MVDPATIQALGNTPDTLEQLLQQLKHAGKLDSPRLEGKWTPRQILMHLTDFEGMFMLRFYQHVTQDKPALFMLNQDIVMEQSLGGQRDVRLALDAFRAQRLRNLEFVRGLNAAQLDRLSMHPVRGERNLAEWVALLVWHDENHLKQMRESLTDPQ